MYVDAAAYLRIGRYASAINGFQSDYFCSGPGLLQADVLSTLFFFPI